MVTLDRHAWAAAPDEHGREVDCDDNNNVDIQLQLAQREIDVSWQPPAVKFTTFSMPWQVLK